MKKFRSKGSESANDALRMPAHLRAFPISGIFDRRLALVSALLLTLCSPLAYATPQEKENRKKQDKPQLEKSESAQASEKSQDDKKKGGFRIGVDVNQVVIHVTAHDKNGSLVPGLQKENFQVYEDKVLQTITNFGQVDLPATLGLVIDKSGSMKRKAELVTRAAKQFVDKANPENEFFLIEFSQDVELVEDLTRDFDDIRDALDNMIVSGGTSLYDAIYLGVEKASEGSEPKKVVLVFTDGEDQDSYYKLDELLAKIRDSDVQVYMIVFIDEDIGREGGFFGIKKSEKEKLEKKMSEIAEATGGKVYYPNRLEDLAGVFTSIANELRNQYRIAYVSANLVRDGKWREIRVQLSNLQPNQQYRIRTKRGYYAK
ncbi:MAG TPA: VWA domain-containing protein [Acidobacteriota bacterium]|jgi:VWFA-related protein